MDYAILKIHELIEPKIVRNSHLIIGTLPNIPTYQKVWHFLQIQNSEKKPDFRLTLTQFLT